MRPVLRAAALLFLAAPSLRAQIPDARLLPRGTLRWSFTPWWNSWDRVLDTTGTQRLLRGFVSSDSAGADLFSTLTPAETAVRGIIGDNTYRLTLGALKTTLDADVRRFPLEFAVGLGRRVTVTGTFPLVTTRANSDLTLDSTKGNAGWNQFASQSGSPTGPSQVASLLGQLGTAATQLAQRIAAGTATCAQPAQTVLSRTQSLRGNLATLAGSGTLVLPPAAPTLGSPAGAAIVSAVSSLWQDLATCGVTGINSSVNMPLPARRFSGGDVQTMLTAPGLGYEGSEFEYTKLTGLGDAELGIRIGIVQAAHARVVVFGTARLPTGLRDKPENFIDLAPGDRQVDVTGGFEAALEPGSTVSLSLAGSFTRQFPDELDRRIAPPDQIINPAPVARVRRDLGDQFFLSAFPGIRLNDAFRVYGGGTYYRKGEDRYTGAINAEVLDTRTAMETMSFGGGIQYRSVGGTRQLPVEAGLTYSAVYTGSGGLTPKATTLTMYLRFYYRLWGGGGPAERGTGSGS